jgi:hypothetical protein
MKRRHFIAIALFALISLAITAWRYWWMTRRALIRLKLMKPPANLLRNADFSQCTNPDIPDYWGTTDAALLQDFSQVFQIEGSSPLKNVRALRVHNPQPDFELSLQSCATFLAKPRPYTFSIYLRSDVEEFAVELSIGWGGRNSIAVNHIWQRYEMVYTPHLKGEMHQGFQVRVSLQQRGNLWLAAPQLEEGEEATTFVTALMDDHPLPVFPEPKTDELIVMQARESLAEDQLIKTDPDLQAIQINRLHRCLMKDGKPFTVFGIAISEPQEWQLEDIAGQGFNSVAIILPAGSEKRDAKKSIDSILAQFDAAHRQGLQVIPLVTHEAETNLEQMIHEKVRFIKLLKHHPAILCWWILDEPTQHIIFNSEFEPFDFYQAAKDADPSRPAFINENVWREGDWLKKFLQSTDIISVDMYPVGQYQNPLSALAERVSLMNREAVAARKPSAFWLQLYGNYDAPREPTPEELRAMTYLVLIRGVRLFCYWAYKPMNQILWESLKPLFEEMKLVTEILMRDQARWYSTGTIQIQIHFSLWDVGEKYYLIACNTSSESVAAKFNFEQIAGRSFAQYQSWFEGNIKNFSGKGFDIKFLPYERQVIELW